MNKYCIGDIVESNLYGKAEIVDRKDGKWVLRFFNTGTLAPFPAGDITRGSIRDYNAKSIFGVACFGYGDFIAKDRKTKKDTPCYKCWNHMISRCYNEKDKSYPRYGGRGIRVCDEWLVFQNFAKWYYDQYPSDGKKYELDKDIKIDGNKIYCPRACLFVSKKENTIKANAKNYVFKSAGGEVFNVYNMSEFCRKNNLSIPAMCSVWKGKRRHHKGWKKGA